MGERKEGAGKLKRPCVMGGDWVMAGDSERLWAVIRPWAVMGGD
jgi:hypothetical protein